MNKAAVVVRRAEADDAAAIAALIAMGDAKAPMTREAACSEARHPAYGMAFARLAASPDNRLFVATIGGRVVGTFQLTALPGLAERGRMRGKIESVHVDPDFRSRGIGTIMIARAIEEARAMGVGLLELSSNKKRVDAHRFYVRLGFAQSHEGFKMSL